MKHYERSKVSQEQATKIGLEKWFFRIVRFEHGVVIDGTVNDELALVMLAMMHDAKEFKHLIKKVNKLYKKTKGNPIAADAIKSLLYDTGSHGECTCAACEMQRTFEKMQKEN